MIDHQSYGDPDYSGPDRYWKESSLGKTYTFLQLGEPLQSDRVLAAINYDFNAAIQGRCPGVTTQEVLEYQISKISLATSFPKDKVCEEIEKYCSLIYSVPSVEFAGQSVVRFPHTGVGYSLSFLAAKLAASLLGVAVLICFREVRDVPDKLYLCGDVKASTVKYFMKIWAPSQGVEKIYGEPNYGYAGGVLV